MREISRRDFLKVGGGLIAAGAMLHAGCEDESPDGGSVTTPPKPPAVARVAAVRGDDLETMTRDALDALGGIASIVHEGETVFIKPNLVTIGWAHLNRNPFLLGECTKPEVLAAVAEECLKAVAREVTIGDGTQVSSYSWEYATWLDGSLNLLQEARRLESVYGRKVTLACLDADSPSWVDVPSRTTLGKIAVSSLVANADRVISVPVLKTHQWAQLTLSLKNFVGVTPLARYGATTNGHTPRVLLHGPTGGIEQVFLDVVAALKPDLAIIDASVCVEGDGPATGPDNGLTVDMKERAGKWLLLAGTDLAAVDATTARVINHDVGELRQLAMAQEQGIGETREEAIELVGARLDEIAVEWKPATPAAAPVAMRPGYPLGRGHAIA